jgi:hypothetical protein
MDGELLRHLYHELFHHGKRGLPRRCTYSDAVVVFIYFVAVVSDRSVHWAHERHHWPPWARRLPRPSYSQLMRRLPTASIQRRIDELNTSFRGRLTRTREKVIDGKPLVVGAHSKDADARWGRLSNTAWGLGYKLHALVDGAGPIDAFAVTPLNAGESTIACQMVAPLDLRSFVVRGDANYDSNPLYESIAGRGGRLIAARRKPGRGLSHSHQQHPHRLLAMELLEQAPGALAIHDQHRDRVEQIFAHLTNLSFGLSPLPNWVRRLDRVTRWVQAKITLYHLFLSLAPSAAKVA